MSLTGRIYKIYSPQLEICYIGSTFNTVRDRFGKHKNAFNQWLKDKHSEVSIYPFFKEQGIESFRCVLVKEYQVADKRTLSALEQLWINKFRKTAVNKNCAFSIPIVAKEQNKQYRESNFEHIKERKKKYYEANKDNHKDRMKDYYEANKDKMKDQMKTYRDENKDKTKQYNKQYNVENKDKINAKRSIQSECACGGIYTDRHKARHMKSKKHTNWLATQN